MRSARRVAVDTVPTEGYSGEDKKAIAAGKLQSIKARRRTDHPRIENRPSVGVHRNDEAGINDIVGLRRLEDRCGGEGKQGSKKTAESGGWHGMQRVSGLMGRRECKGSSPESAPSSTARYGPKKKIYRAARECNIQIRYRNTAILSVPADGRPDRLGFCGQDDREPSTSPGGHSETEPMG